MNYDKQAFPSYENSHGVTVGNEGLTAREYAAIHLRVADSGSDWLDAMIRANLTITAFGPAPFSYSDAQGEWTVRKFAQWKSGDKDISAPPIDEVMEILVEMRRRYIAAVIADSASNGSSK